MLVGFSSVVGPTYLACSRATITLAPQRHASRYKVPALLFICMSQKGPSDSDKYLKSLNLIRHLIDTANDSESLPKCFKQKTGQLP